MADQVTQEHGQHGQHAQHAQEQARTAQADRARRLTEQVAGMGTEATAMWTEASQRMMAEMAELAIGNARETARCLTEMQQASLDALREQRGAVARWWSAWPDALADPLRWYQKALMESVNNAQRTLDVMAANARRMSEAVERMQASAVQSSRRMDEVLSSQASRIKESARRAA